MCERLLEKQQQCGRYARADHDTPRGSLVREDVGVETVHNAKSVFLSRSRAAGGRTSWTRRWPPRTTPRKGRRRRSGPGFRENLWSCAWKWRRRCPRPPCRASPLPPPENGWSPLPSGTGASPPPYGASPTPSPCTSATCRGRWWRARLPPPPRCGVSRTTADAPWSLCGHRCGGTRKGRRGGSLSGSRDWPGTTAPENRGHPGPRRLWTSLSSPSACATSAATSCPCPSSRRGSWAILSSWPSLRRFARTLVSWNVVIT